MLRMKEPTLDKPILTDTSPAGMIEAIETAVRAGWHSLSVSPRFEVRDGREGLWFASGIPFPPFNGIVQARLDGDVEEAIDRAIEFFRSRSLPFTWTVSPSTRPEDLGERLEARGFATDNVEAGMAIALDTLPESVPSPAGFEVERVWGERMLGDYSRLVATGFGLPGDAADEFMGIIAEFTALPGATSWGYLGRLDGEAVATSGLILEGGAALVINVVTLPEARRKGIGAVMTHQALLDARENGYRIGTLEASGMGYPVYKRLGMEEYCSMRPYAWKPPAKG